MNSEILLFGEEVRLLKGQNLESMQSKVFEGFIPSTGELCVVKQLKLNNIGFNALIKELQVQLISRLSQQKASEYAKRRKVFSQFADKNRNLLEINYQGELIDNQTNENEIELNGFPIVYSLKMTKMFAELHMEHMGMSLNLFQRESNLKLD